MSHLVHEVPDERQSAAFLALQGTRALYLETTLGFPVMVGAREFADFEAAFRDHVYGLYESGAE